MLLTTIALAADPTYVLLARDAALCPDKKDKDCQVVEAPRAPSEPWRDARTWTLLAQDGDWLQVQNVVNPALCLAPAPVTAGFTVTAWVQKKYLVRGLSRVVEVTGQTGAKVTLGAGFGVGDSGAGKTLVGSDVAHARLPIPEDAVADTWTLTAAPLPEGATRQTLDNPGAIGLADLGAVTWISSGGPILRSEEEGITTAASADRGCMILTASSTAFTGIRTKEPAPATPVEPHGKLIVMGGTALRWPNGATAGTANGNILVEEGKKQKGRVCFDAWEGDSTLTLCI